MKRTITLFLLLFVTSLFYAQNWNLFPLNQSSYYMIGPDSNAVIELSLSDSQKVVSTSTTQFYMTKPPIPNHCYQSNPSHFNDNWNKSNTVLDSTVLHSDSILLYKMGNALTFKPYSAINDSWTSHGITFTCIDKKLVNVLGIPDSVKVFDGSFNGNTFEWELSKSFGFLRYHDMLSFFLASVSPQPKKLIGLESNQFKLGYNHPSFEDFFPLQAGDQLFWKHKRTPDDPFAQTTIYYTSDSIISSSVNNDSAVYIKRVKKFDDQYQLVNQYTSTHTSHRKYIGDYLSIPGGWFGLGQKESFIDKIPITESSLLKLKIENGDTLTKIQHNFMNVVIDTMDCSTFQLSNSFTNDIYDTKHGRIQRSSYTIGESIDTLIGSIINGNHQGNTLLVGINNFSNQKLKLYPIPAKNHLMIDLPLTLKGIRYTIYDLNGKALESNTMIDSIIPLHAIQNGIYFIQFNHPSGFNRALQFVVSR